MWTSVRGAVCIMLFDIKFKYASLMQALCVCKYFGRPLQWEGRNCTVLSVKLGNTDGNILQLS